MIGRRGAIPRHTFRGIPPHRPLFKGGISATVAIILAACTPAADDDLVVWHAYRGKERAAFDAVVEAYNAQRTEGAAAVTAVAVPYDAFADKISAAVPAGRGPDVFIFAQDRLVGWAESGDTLEPLDFFLEEETRAQFLPGLGEALQYHGVTWALPINFKSIALIYNPELVPDPPETSGELVTVAQSLTDAAAGRFGLAYPYTDYFFHGALQNGFGGGALDARANPTLDHPGNVRAGELLLAWLNVDRILPGDASNALVGSLYNAGRVGMVFSGPWFLGEVAPGVPVAVAPLPSLDEADGAPIRPWLTIEAAYLAAGTGRTEQAFAFASFLAGPQAGVILTTDGGQLHANAAVYSHPTVAADPVAAAFKTQLLTAEPMPIAPEMTLVWSPGERALNLIARGTEPPEVALARAQADVSASVEALRRSRRPEG